MTLSPDDRFSLGSITRRTIAADFNDAMSDSHFAPDDSRLTEDVCTRYASDIGEDPEMREHFAEEYASEILGLSDDFDDDEDDDWDDGWDDDDDYWDDEDDDDFDDDEDEDWDLDDEDL